MPIISIPGPGAVGKPIITPCDAQGLRCSLVVTASWAYPVPSTGDITGFIVTVSSDREVSEDVIGPGLLCC